jgi:multiple sugar transport system permease protein
VAATTAAPARPRRRAGGRRARQALVAWGFALPFFVLFVVFMAGPVLASLAMSFTDMRSTDLRHPFAVNFVGVGNYARLLGDEVFRQAALNTAYFVVVAIPLTIVLALVVAVGLNSGITRLRTVFRLGYYLPVVTSIVAVAVVWRFLLQPDTGPLNQVLGWFGIHGPDWLNSSAWAMPALILMTAWRNLGTLMVIFLAGLQAIPPELYEAAELDGAGMWQRFSRITVPLLRPALLFGAVITGIGYLQFFEEPFVMTQGGPLNHTLSVAYDIFNQFGFGNYGYAAAMGYVLFVVIVAMTVLQFRLLRPTT